MKVRGKETLETELERISLQTVFRSFLRRERAYVCARVCVCVSRGWYLAWFVFILTSQCVTALFMCLTEAAASVHLWAQHRAHTLSLSLLLYAFTSSILLTHSHFVSNFATTSLTAYFSSNTMKKNLLLLPFLKVFPLMPLHLLVVKFCFCSCKVHKTPNRDI